MPSFVDRYIGDVYIRENPDWHESDSPWKAKQIAKIVTRNDLFPKSICEIGCGVGRVCSEIAFHLPSVEIIDGYDISGTAISIARSKHETEKVHFFCNDLAALDLKYELLLCIDVFEHVPDYIGFLKAIRSKADFFIFHIPLDLHVSYLLRDQFTHARKKFGHLHYFSKSTAIATLQDVGYVIEDSLYTPGVLELESANRGIISKSANIVRRAISFFSEDICAKLLGGYSLLALCTRNPDEGPRVSFGLGEEALDRRLQLDERA